MPLEYRDLEIMELLANHLGIFVKHDLIPFKPPHISLKVCLLLDLSKSFPKHLSITLNFGGWNQPLIVQDPKMVDTHTESLGHLTSECQGPNYQNIIL